MIVIIMGVVGAGKTTVGSLLAQQLHWEFADADDFHPHSNIEKIRRGIPLTDADREPWLDRMSQAVGGWIKARKNVVLACSALKRKYRQELVLGPEVRFVYLKGSAPLIATRLHARQGHFAGESILASQMADLEEPEMAVVADITRTPTQIVEDIRKQLALG
jgi:gluconokinase